MHQIELKINLTLDGHEQTSEQLHERFHALVEKLVDAEGIAAMIDKEVGAQIHDCRIGIKLEKADPTTVLLHEALGRLLSGMFESGALDPDNMPEGMTVRRVSGEETPKAKAERLTDLGDNVFGFPGNDTKH